MRCPSSRTREPAPLVYPTRPGRDGAVNCLDCGEQFGSARPAIGVCVVCGAGVCRPHADIRVSARPVQSGVLAPAQPYPRRAVRCLACQQGATPPPWLPPVRGRRRIFGVTDPAEERR